jgi:hypothetical protein
MAYPKFETITMEKDKEEPKVTYLTLSGNSKFIHLWINRE